MELSIFASILLLLFSGILVNMFILCNIKFRIPLNKPHTVKSPLYKLTNPEGKDGYIVKYEYIGESLPDLNGAWTFVPCSYLFQRYAHYEVASRFVIHKRLLESGLTLEQYFNRILEEEEESKKLRKEIISPLVNLNEDFNKNYIG